MHVTALVATERALAERTPGCPVVMSALREVQRAIWRAERQTAFTRTGQARIGDDFDDWRATRPATIAIEG